MWRKARTVLSLPAGDRWIIAQAWILFLLVDLGLRSMPFQSVQNWLGWGQKFASRENSVDEAGQVSRLNQLVKIAGRNHIYPMTCLRQALVLKWLLDRNKIKTNLRIGVKREQDQFNAHAWIEYRHQPVGEPGTVSREFSPMAVCVTE